MGHLIEIPLAIDSIERIVPLPDSRRFAIVSSAGPLAFVGPKPKAGQGPR